MTKYKLETNKVAHIDKIYQLITNIVEGNLEVRSKFPLILDELSVVLMVQNELKGLNAKI